MEDDAYTPKGYCPQCGHAIDPGTCQECGREVTARALRRRPPREFAHTKAVIAILVGASLFIAYHQLNWIRYIPTSILLRAQGDAFTRPAEELGRRFSLGTLTHAETDRFVRQAVLISPQLAVRDPYPAGEPIRIGLPIANQLPLRHCRPRVVLERATINGQVAPAKQGQWRARVGDYVEGFELDPQPLGHHEFTLRAVLNVTSWRKGYNSGWDQNIELTTEFDVVENPLTEFVTPVFSSGLAEKVREGWHLAVKFSTFGLWISDDLPPIAAEAYWRVTGEGAWRKAHANIENNGVLMPPFVLLSAFPYTGTMARRVDFKIVGDAKIAFDAGLTEYFAGVIEWVDIPVDDSGTRVFHAPDYRRESTYAPKRVYPIGESPDPSTDEAD